ncbi:MAG: RICIN domain-containing protein, partial [bacterium]
MKKRRLINILLAVTIVAALVVQGAGAVKVSAQSAEETSFTQGTSAAKVSAQSAEETSFTQGTSAAKVSAQSAAEEAALIEGTYEESPILKVTPQPDASPEDRSDENGLFPENDLQSETTFEEEGEGIVQEALSGEQKEIETLEILIEEESAFAEETEKTSGESEAVFPEEGGWYRLVPKSAPNMVLGTVDGAMVNGTAIIAAQYMRLEHQIFRFDKGENGGWILTNGASEKVAALENADKGAALGIYSRGKDGSEFRVTKLKNGNITLRNSDGRYLKVLSGKVVAGNKKRTDAAEFSLALATNVPDLSFSRTYFLRTLSRIRLVAGISKSSKADGAKSLLSNYSGAAAQRFSFMYSSDGYYRIVSEKSRKVLTVLSDGSVAQKKWTSANAQRWRPVAAQGGHYLINADGNVLTVQGDYVKRGRALTAEARDSTKNQIFLLLERGSAEAKKNLIKKPVTIYQGVDYAAVYNYDDYMDRYTNLANVYGTDCAGALQYFVEHGMAEGQHGSNAFNVWCYRRRNHEVRKELLADIPAYYRHYIKEGKAQGLPAIGDFQSTQAASLHDLAWKAYNEAGTFQNRPAGQEMCEYLSRAAQVEYEAYGFPKSIVIAVAIKECGFLTFNDGLPPMTNNVLTMNVSLWNGLWKSSWLGNYVSVRVPQYDSVLGKIVYGYEPVRCYEDIEACM